MDSAPQRALVDYQECAPEEMAARARDFYQQMRKRRSVRAFSPRAVPREVIEDCVRAAGTAPSGANRQPWHFVVVANADAKRRVRDAAEKVEAEFYAGRASEEWLDALEPIGTDSHKPFLEAAPYLVAIFAESYGLDADGAKVRNYYVNESVGIATGMLITAVHHAGLVCLTHTPSPMSFLSEVLERPKNERPFLLLVVGYPAEDATVPQTTKKTLGEMATFVL